MTDPVPDRPPVLATEDPDGSGEADAAIALRDCGKSFGSTWVLRHLDVTMPRGSIVGLIGPSGCGKTTTIRMATGVYAPDEGSVRLLGRPPHELPVRERVLIGYLPQEPVLFEELSLWENLNFHASLSGVRFRRRRRLRRLLDLVDLDEHRRKLVREASGGMKRRLALAATLVHEPPILILDEPTAGIDPVLRRRLWDHFRTLRDEGRTLVVATQYVGEAVDCDRVVLLDEGRSIASGSPDHLRRQAFGGELVEIQMAESFSPTDLATLGQLPAVEAVQLVTANQARLVVTDPAVLNNAVDLLRDAGHDVNDAKRVIADYDDVFVALVQQQGAPPADGRVDRAVDA